MSVLTILTYVALAVLVLAVAVSLLTIVVILRRIRETAGLIVFGVRAIAERAKPVGPVVAEINADLIAVQGALHGLMEKAGLEKKDEEEAPEVVEPAEDSRRGGSEEPAGVGGSIRPGTEHGGDRMTGGSDGA